MFSEPRLYQTDNDLDAMRDLVAVLPAVDT